MARTIEYVWLTLYFTGLLSARAPFAKAQCPDRSALWKRIVFLRDSTKPPPGEQLKELLPYVEKMEHCGYTRDSTYALLLQRIGVLYLLQSDMVRSLPFMRRSIDVIRTNAGSPSINPRHLIRFYYNLRFYFAALKLHNKVNEATDSCIAIALRTGSGDPLMLYALAERVNELLDIGDYHRCIQYADIAASLPHDSTAKMAELSIQILAKKINALNFLNDFEAASKVLADSAARFRTIAGHKFVGSMYGLRATTNVGEGKFGQALMDFQRSFALNKKINYDDGCAEALNNIGFLYQKNLGKYDTALFYYRKALPYAASAADSVETLNILDNIANVYVHRGRYDSAFFFFQAAFDQIRPGLDETALSHLPAGEIPANNIIEYVTGLILDKGDALLQKFKSDRAREDIEKAVALYRSADRFFDSIKTGQSEIRSRLFWRAHIRRLYENAIEACYLSRKREDAFYFFEKSRAVLLEDQLYEEGISDEEDIIRLAQLKKKMLQDQKNLNNLADTAVPNRAEIQSDLFDSRRETEHVEQSIRARNPLYYQSFLDTVFITLRQAQSELSNDRQFLIELFTGDSADYCLIVTPRDVRLSRINREDFDSTANRFISYISDPAALNRHFGEYMTAAFHLYHLLFPHALSPHDPSPPNDPLSRQDPLPTGRVIVSLDNRWFPFEALMSQMPPSAPRYFLADYAVSYAYSFRYLQYAGINHTDSSAKIFLGVAPIEYKGAQHLQPLKGSETSLRHIAADFPASSYLIGNTATRANFLHEFYHYSIIQLYTHAATGSGENDDPVIYFADSALYLSDLIPETKPATKLIVLSACETGSGKLYAGEGVFSFSRGFAALGIPSSISNLWTTDDQSTYRLTELFYHYLTEGLPADRALQQAKLDFIGDGSGEKSLPYYWAAPVIAGDGSFTITQSSIWPGWPLLIELLVIAIAAWLILKRRPHR
jgi:tetratricopeptide (TPR) repeat protein